MAKWDTAFNRIVACVAAGERCPTNEQIPGGAFSALAREGRIWVRVFRKNYRVVDILVGPYAGKSTADAVDRKVGEVPYKIVDATASALRVSIPKMNRQEPWKPGQPRLR